MSSTNTYPQRDHTMKTSFAFIVTALLWAAALCQAADRVPALINYQGKLLDSSGNIVPNGNYELEFRVWSAGSSGTLIWGRNYPVNVAEGLFNVVLGDGGGDLSGAQTTNLVASFDGSDRFLGLTIRKDNTGATVANAQEIVPRQQLLSAPYALGANDAAKLGGILATNYLTNGNVIVNGSVRSSNLQLDDTAYFKMQNIGGGNNPVIAFDGNDYMYYKRTENQLLFMNGGAEKLRITSSNMVASALITASGGIEGPGTVPLGTIVMWSGSNVPSGWALCDGNNNTPDLRGRFVLASGSGSGLTTRSIKQTGGEESHTLTTSEMPVHTHALNVNTVGYTSGYNGNAEATAAPGNTGRNNGTQTWTPPNAGSGAAHNTMPPYFVLAFIMRVQ